jgi:glycosyltransferase involved in cell wall biosynthesis
MPDVSVVIPTTGRPSVAEAVRSAREQRGVSVQIVVVCDTAEIPETVNEIRSEIDEIAVTGGGRRGSFARNLGVSRSTAENHVAFLDDDDAWLPGKLAAQAPVADRLIEQGSHPIVSSRILQRQFGGAPLQTVAPAAVIPDGVLPEDYLFRRRQLGIGRQSLPTSTLFTSRQLAATCPWDETLSRHQDWDWLVRATRVPGARLVQIEDATAVYTVGSPGSLSAGADWRTSWTWVQRWEGVWDRKTFSDFVAAQTLRYALQARDWKGAAELIRAIRRNAMPSATNALQAVLGVLPRATLERLAVLQSRVRPGSARTEAANGAR